MKQGQTLVLLLVFMTVASIIISAAVIVTVINSTSSSKLERGNVALEIAESGAENALLRLLRDPAYAGEPGITVAGGVITAVGQDAGFTRTIVVTTNYNNNVLTVTSWREKF